ncbi:MAG: response regulator [Acidobacteriota bacterium]|nr:response regulator [Acidobacteriota bacterium]
MTPDAPRILVADDDPALRPLISVICKHLGFLCDGAPDGEVALEKIRSGHYDVVLLDLMMPKINGREVIEALRELPKRPAVIVLTAQNLKKTEGIVDGNVVHAVIQKPFDLAELTALLTDLAPAVHKARKQQATK